MQFNYYDDKDNLIFSGKIKSGKCKKRGCKRICYIPIEYCDEHLPIMNLQIRPSQIKNAGNGLYAFNEDYDNSDIIFEGGDEICEYIGEILDENEKNTRYGDMNASYAVDLFDGRFIDSALMRGIGSIANHHPSKFNAVLKTKVVKDNLKCYLFATNDIYNNQEILLNYGDEYNFNKGRHETIMTNNNPTNSNSRQNREIIIIDDSDTEEKPKPKLNKRKIETIIIDDSDEEIKPSVKQTFKKKVLPIFFEDD